MLGSPQIFAVGPSNDDPWLSYTASRPCLREFRREPHKLGDYQRGTFSATGLPEGDFCLHSVDLAIGRFGNLAHDQLVVAYAAEGGNVKILPSILISRVIWSRSRSTIPATRGRGQAWIRSGQFDWSNPFDQAALLIAAGQQNSPNTNTLRILTFDQSLNVQSGPVSTDIGQGGLCIGDAAVGNFDSMQANPTPPPDTIRNPNLQVAAFLQTTCGTANFAVQIWDVTPVDTPRASFKWIRRIRSSFSPNADNLGVEPQTMAMAAVDLQGRSARLGRLPR